MVEIQVQMHKRNRVKIPDKTVAVFSSKGCAEKSFLSHWKIPGRLISAAISRNTCLCFTRFQTGVVCFLRNSGKQMKKLWRAAWFKDILKDALLCCFVNTRHRLENSERCLFYVNLRSEKE